MVCIGDPSTEASPVETEARNWKITMEDTLRVQRYMDSLLALKGVSISVAVGYRDELLFSLARGYRNLSDSSLAGPGDRYRLGSVSKVLGSTLLFTFIEKGEIRLEDSLQQWLPEFPRKAHPVRLSHLLTHTSGIRHYDGRYPRRPAAPPQGLQDLHRGPLPVQGRCPAL